MWMQQFFQMLKYFLATNILDDTAGDFNDDLLKLLENKILDNFIDHAQIVNNT